MHCLRLQLGNTNCRLSAFINCWVNQALQIVPTHATTKAFLEHQENRFKLKQKRSLTAFLDSGQLPYFSEYLGPSQIRWKSLGPSLSHARPLHSGQVSEGTLMCFLIEPPNDPAGLLSYPPFNRETEAQLRRVHLFAQGH